MFTNPMEILKEAITRLVRTYSPLKIIVFGSYAWGTPTLESDIDVLVIVEKSDQKGYQRSIAGDMALRGLDIDRDILVYTQEEFEERAQSKSSLLYKIKQEGKCVYVRA